MKTHRKINNRNGEGAPSSPHPPARSSNAGENVLHGDGRQVGVEAALVVAASENEQGPADGDGAAAAALLLRLLCRQASGNGRLHGDDGVPRPGDGQLREVHFCPGVGVWGEGEVSY